MKAVKIEGPGGQVDVVINVNPDSEENVVTVRMVAYSDDTYTLLVEEGEAREEVIELILPDLADACDEVNILFGEDTRILVQVLRGQHG